MPHHPNNDLHKFPSERRKGIVGTSIIHLVLLLLLVLVGFSVPPPPETEEGILVNFGTDETGSGMIEPSPPVVNEDVPPPIPATTVEEQAEDPLLTQDFEEAPEVVKADPEAERIEQEKIEADRILNEQLEAERIRKEQEEIERKKIETERVRQAEIMDRTKNALANSKKAGTNTTGEGVTGGEGNQGSPTGSINTNVRGDGDGDGLGDQGPSYSLEGRDVLKLPLPEYKSQDYGTVVVEVIVDRSGKVINARSGIKGTDADSEYLRKVAKDAAMQARFEAKPDAPVIQKGSITYKFKLR